MYSVEATKYLVSETKRYPKSILIWFSKSIERSTGFSAFLLLLSFIAWVNYDNNFASDILLNLTWYIPVFQIYGIWREASFEFKSKLQIK